jgi:hypothetical protein
MLMGRAKDGGVRWTNETEELSSAEKIAASVGGHPFAADWIATFVVKKQMCLSDYLEHCQHVPDYQIPFYPPTDGEREKVDKVFQSSFDEISKNNEAKETMGIIAFCSVDPIPYHLLSFGSHRLKGCYYLRAVADTAYQCTGPSTGRMPIEFRSVLEKLTAYHLVNIDTAKGKFSVNPMVQLMYRKRLSEGERQSSIIALGTLLATLLKEPQLRKDSLFCKGLIPHVTACCRWMDKLKVTNTDFILHEARELLDKFVSETTEKSTFQDANC